MWCADLHTQLIYLRHLTGSEIPGSQSTPSPVLVMVLVFQMQGMSLTRRHGKVARNIPLN